MPPWCSSCSADSLAIPPCICESATKLLKHALSHVLIARHRPQSNGIAARFVRTLKEWLADQAWPDDLALATLLQQFLTEYGDRPHQGLALPGLSPNEFAKRIWLM